MTSDRKAGETVSETILLVDDDASMLRTVGRLLQRNGYVCETANSAEEAREYLSKATFSLVLSDMNMPGRSGLELLEEVVAGASDTAILMVTGVDDRRLAERALTVGAYGYIIKPFEPNELLIGVSNALRRRSLEIENRRHRDKLESMVQERTSHLWSALGELEQAKEGIRQSHTKTIEKLAIAAEFRDLETADHIRRMSHYCELLALKCGYDIQKSSLIRTAAIMHDVGKMGIPDGILMKPGKLEPNEYEVMKGHPEIGFQILRDNSSELLELAATIALTHHERIDGRGYPHGIGGTEIPVEGRIAAIADVFDALTSNRIYRPAFHLGEAMELMSEGRGSHFDAELLDVFMDSIDEVLAIRAESGLMELSRTA
ncbi:MAG: HD domain-containing phosphohydrolase [Actinomycetota bacterium]